ncbi:SMI1/KNR4 family protein [Tsukamurella pulmonis]|uniref:SMI1/KNR4 family protein n=1 Tax=Tsukamurella pulmonis TaxID=47312 RepID=UPI001111F760|nr:SMI1/KNR4 family protein [Tsukamurella pulmonis]
MGRLMNIEEELGLTPWTSEDVREVEAQLGPLPLAYKNFVLKFGSGYFTSQGLPDTDAIVTKFLEPIYVLNKTGFAEWIPSSYYPVIGGTGGALALEKGTGVVFFADYDLGVDMGLESEASDEIMSKYANSWSELEIAMRSWVYG